jgi:hypothetical protein
VTGSRPRRGRRTVANGSATAAGLRRDAGRADLRPPPRPGFGLPSDRRASRRRQPSSSSPSRCESVVMNDHPTHRHRWLDGGVPHEASFVGTPGGPGRTRSRGAGFLLCTPRSRLRGDPTAGSLGPGAGPRPVRVWVQAASSGGQARPAHGTPSGIIARRAGLRSPGEPPGGARTWPTSPATSSPAVPPGAAAGSGPAQRTARSVSRSKRCNRSTFTASRTRSPTDTLRSGSTRAVQSSAPTLP